MVVCCFYLHMMPKILLLHRDLWTSCDNVRNNILECDSNAHHSAWGSTTFNDRGEALVCFPSASNLEILNWGNEPTFSSEQRQDMVVPLGS
jgi:hypothetical protein